MSRWPDFFIVGAPKAGSTSLYNYLNVVPDVFMPEVKEPRYFAPTVLEFQNAPRMSQQDYLDLFAAADGQTALGEASVAHLRDPLSPGLIHAAAPDAKIIISLRDPVQRAYSHYVTALGRGQVDLSFAEVIDESRPIADKYRTLRELVLAPGYYADGLRRYQEQFGEERVKVILFERFVRQPRQTIAELLEFLGIDPDSAPHEFKRHNPSFAPRNKLAMGILRNKAIQHSAKALLPRWAIGVVRTSVLNKKGAKPPLPEWDREYLTGLYREDVQRVRGMLDMEIPWEL